MFVLKSIQNPSLLGRLVLFAAILMPLSLAPSSAQTETAAALSDRLDLEIECERDEREQSGVCEKIAVPANAFGTNSAYGQGWQCSWGYIQKGSTCLALVKPDNAYVDASGDRWKCDRGFRRSENLCEAIIIPKNGYLSNSAYGSGWECERGFRADEDKCVAINVPENAYLTNASHGPGWKCVRGYQSDGNICVELQVPENAHVDYSGNDWECNRPYLKRQDVCVRI